MEGWMKVQASIVDLEESAFCGISELLCHGASEPCGKSAIQWTGRGWAAKRGGSDWL